jgi:hypothetical protein
MTERPPVTRIRQELTSTPFNNNAADRFVAKFLQPGADIHFYTTAEREVPLLDYHRTRRMEFRRGEADAETTMRRLGHNAFVLCAPVVVAQMGPLVRATFDIDPASQRPLDELADAMNDIVLIDEEEEAKIYAEFLASKVTGAHDTEELAAKMSSQLRHPGFDWRLSVWHPQLRTHDLYPQAALRGPEIAAEEQT